MICSVFLSISLGLRFDVIEKSSICSIRSIWRKVGESSKSGRKKGSNVGVILPSSAHNCDGPSPGKLVSTFFLPSLAVWLCNGPLIRLEF